MDSALRGAQGKKNNRLLAFNLSAHVGDQFPVFQIENGKVRAWVPYLLRPAGNDLPAVHVLTVNCKSLAGESYFDLLSESDRAEMIDGMLAHAAGMGYAAARRLPKLRPGPQLRSRERRAG